MVNMWKFSSVFSVFSMDRKQGHHLGIRMKQKQYRIVNWKFVRVNVLGKYGMIASQLKGLFEANGYKLW